MRITEGKDLNLPNAMWIKEKTSGELPYLPMNVKFFFGSDGGATQWLKPNQGLNPMNLQVTVKHSDGNIMMWDWISSSDVREITIVKETNKPAVFRKLVCTIWQYA